MSGFQFFSAVTSWALPSSIVCGLKCVGKYKHLSIICTWEVLKSPDIRSARCQRAQKSLRYFVSMSPILQSYDDLMGINTRGVFMCLKHQIPLMLATSEAPAIVITASGAGHAASPCMSVYSTSKWALRGLAATAAKEYGTLGLR